MTEVNHTTSDRAYARLGAVASYHMANRCIELRKSKSILEELLLRTDNDFAYGAICISIKKINEEISALTR